MMQSQIVKGKYAMVDGVWKPSYAVFTDDVIEETREGYGARLSMPGFLDATEWTVCATLEEAERALLLMYEECIRCDNDGCDFCGGNDE